MTGQVAGQGLVTLEMQGLIGLLLVGSLLVVLPGGGAAFR